VAEVVAVVVVAATVLLVAKGQHQAWAVEEMVGTLVDHKFLCKILTLPQQTLLW
jgi:hypothetical protein